MAAIDSTHIKAHPSAAGGKGGLRPGDRPLARRSDLQDHGLADDTGRPRVLLLSPGNINDIAMAASMVQSASPIRRLIADRGFDANHRCQLLADRNTEAVISSTTSRTAPLPYDKNAYRARNLVERMWCRLKDWRRIATRYDKLAQNFPSAVLLAATVTYWLN